MVKNITDLREFIPINTLEMMQSLDEIHSKPSANTIRKKMIHLKPGKTFAMFVRSQNCVLLIHMLPNEPADSETVSNASSDSESIIIATFPGKLHPEEVYGNPNDLEVRLYTIQFDFQLKKWTFLMFFSPPVQLSQRSNRSEMPKNTSFNRVCKNAFVSS